MKWYEDKEYWEMCEKAFKKFEQLRKQWKPKGGDWVYNKGHNKALMILWVEPHHCRFDTAGCIDFNSPPPMGRAILLGDLVPLWTQEDLQEMYCKQKPCAWSICLNDFKRWLFKHFQGRDPQDLDLSIIHSQFSSETQLKFAFVMHELYGKKWNPEEKE